MRLVYPLPPRSASGRLGYGPVPHNTLPQAPLSTAERSLSNDEWTDLFTTLSYQGGAQHDPIF